MRPRRVFWCGAAREARDQRGSLGAGEQEERELGARVLERDLLGEEILVERLDSHRRLARRRHEQDALLEHPHVQKDLDLAVDVEQCGRASLARPEGLDLVAQQRVEERGPIAARDGDDAVIAAVDDADALAHRRILDGGIAVREGHLPPADALQRGSGRAVRVVKRETLRHGVILHGGACYTPRRAPAET